MVCAEPDRLQATLASITANTDCPHEVLLLVDGPDAATTALLAGLTHLRQSATPEPRGAPACFNRLARESDAGVLVLLESGSLVGPGWLGHLLAALEDDPRNGLAGPSTNISWNEQCVYPRAEGGADKVTRTALEAAKQCGNPFVPEILPVQNAAAFMESARGYDLKLIASLQPGAKSLKTVLAGFRAAQQRAPKKVLWLIGPEGDFTPAEMSLSQSAGFEPITLGPLVLRCETAAAYALSILSYELQNA
jgi:hypothetical protein